MEVKRFKKQFFIIRKVKRQNRAFLQFSQLFYECDFFLSFLFPSFKVGVCGDVGRVFVFGGGVVVLVVFFFFLLSLWQSSLFSFFSLLFLSL